MSSTIYTWTYKYEATKETHHFGIYIIEIRWAPRVDAAVDIKRTYPTVSEANKAQVFCAERTNLIIYFLKYSRWRQNQDGKR